MRVITDKRICCQWCPFWRPNYSWAPDEMQKHQEGHHQCKTCLYTPPCHLPSWGQDDALARHSKGCPERVAARAEKKAQIALFHAFEQQMQMIHGCAGGGLCKDAVREVKKYYFQAPV